MTTMKITGGSSITTQNGTMYITGLDADNDFTMIGLSGNYILNGQGGNDRLLLGESSSSFNVSSPDGTGGISVSNQNVAYYLQNFETIVFSDKTINLTGTQGPKLITGSQADDILTGSSSSESIDGGSGLDTLRINTVSRASTSLAANGDGSWSLTGSNVGSDTLHNIERIEFSDRMVALDASASGHAGQAMQFIGTIAPELLNNLGIRGTIISLFDQGYSMLQLCDLALKLDLVAHSTNSELVSDVYQNVIGGKASSSMGNALTQYVEEHGQAEFLATVASLSLNVDLVGLQNTGVEYLAG